MAHATDSRLKRMIREVLDEQRSLRKNGETWSEYARKIVTPERVMLVLLVLFRFGGDLRDAQRALETATRQATEASEKADAASAKAQAAADTLFFVQRNLEAVMATIKEQATFNDQIKGKVDLAVTRQEFNAAMRQQILPRLERIERRIDEATK